MQTNNQRVRVIYKKKRVPLLGKAVSFSWWWIPILPVPLLEVHYLYTPCPPITPSPASCQWNIYLQTDDINMPATPVGHIKDT
jgi:hypothetical protein